MDLRHFRYVQKIAEERSFSKAAEKLFLAQPALSQYILNLERELGTKLFDRSKNPIRLTYAGEIFLHKAQLILEIEQDLSTEIKNLAQSDRGCLKIAISPNRGSYLLPKILPTFSRVYPNIEIKLSEGLTSEFEELLLKNEVDIAILPGEIKSTDIDYTLLQNDQVLLALPPNHCLITQALPVPNNYPMLSLKLFQDEQFIMSKPGQGLRIMADKLFAEAGFKPKIYTETKSFETAHRLALAGLGVVISSSTLGPMNMSDPLRYFSLAEQTPARIIHIAYKKKKNISWPIKEFIRITKELFFLTEQNKKN